MLSTEGPVTFWECAVKENENILPYGLCLELQLMRWCYTLIFNVLYAIKQRLMADNKIAKESVKREVIAGERLYTFWFIQKTLLVY